MKSAPSTETAKRKVLRKWPDAVCLRNPVAKRGYSVWHRIDTTGGPLARGRSPREAWEKAAK